MNDIEFIGAGVITFGAIFFVLGLFSFSKQFLATANLLFIIGLNMSMGPKSFFDFLGQKGKLKGTATFFLGIIIIFFKFTMATLIGVILELVGAYWLFGGFLPLITSMIAKIPVIGMVIPSKWKHGSESLD